MDELSKLANSLLAIVVAAMLVAAVVLFGVALVRAARRSRLTQVIIDPLGDATGDATTGPVTIGLTYRLRQEVVDTLPVLAERARRAVKKAESDPTSPINVLMLEDIDRRAALLNDITSSQDDLMQSMESMVPEAARGAYRVVASALPRPKEVRVTGVLQRLNDGASGVGLSFNVTSVGRDQGASRITLWEDEDADVDGKTVVERFHALIPPAARALACELLHQRLKRTMAARSRRRRAIHWSHGRQVDPDAVVEFLVGGSYHNAANGSAPATKSFYALAARALNQSANRLNYYKVSYQLANTLAELGRRQGTNTAKAIELLSDSSRHLNQAARRLPDGGLQPADHQAEDLRIRAALTVNACLLAELLPDDEIQVRTAATRAVELTTIEPDEYEIDSVLYNVACALAVASRVKGLAPHGIEEHACIERARRWLLHACARNDTWLNYGTADPDLCVLRAWIPDLRRRLWESSSGSDGDGPPDPEALRARIQTVVEALTPTMPGPGDNHGTSCTPKSLPPRPMVRSAPWRGEAFKAIVNAVRAGQPASSHPLKPR